MRRWPELPAAGCRPALVRAPCALAGICAGNPAPSGMSVSPRWSTAEFASVEEFAANMPRLKQRYLVRCKPGGDVCAEAASSARHDDEALVAAGAGSLWCQHDLPSVGALRAR